MTRLRGRAGVAIATRDGSHPEINRISPAIRKAFRPIDRHTYQLPEKHIRIARRLRDSDRLTMWDAAYIMNVAAETLYARDRRERDGPYDT